MMNKLFSWFLILTVAILSQGCGKQLPPEESCNFVLNSKGRRVSWFRSPIQFYADQSLSPEQVRGTLEAMDAWNNSFDRDVFQLIGRTEQLPTPQLDGEGRVISDGYNGIYSVSGDVFTKSRSRDEQGKTSLSFRGDFIFEADILIDSTEKFFFGDVTKSSASREVEFKSLMIHELGHALGLDHIDGSGQSVMRSKLSFGEVRHEISDAELSSLACEY